MEVWKFIEGKLQNAVAVVLLWVLESEGSSPGRRGFKMAVATDTSFIGTIGGGIMEHKLVEKAKYLLAEGVKEILLMRQFHDKEHARDRSGMICSGNQLIAFVPLGVDDLELVEQIMEDLSRNPDSYRDAKEGNAKGAKENARLYLNKNGVEVKYESGGQPGLNYTSDEDWNYYEPIDQRPVIHIIGGGHVGLALSELMHFLDFYVIVYDNREALNTVLQNDFADEKIVVEYENIADCITDDPDAYVAIMTFGYRDDKVVLKQLVDKKFFYVGMLGSDSKIETLKRELAAEGIDVSAYAHCHVPIGINIFSKTTKEIAVSIAAEIIREKNKHLPTGRTLTA